MNEDKPYLRRIRSYVLRQGRATEAQARALADGWDFYGLERDQVGVIDKQKVFGRDAPLVLEIGFGMGQSLVAMANTQPEQDFIGIEVHRPGVGSVIMHAIEQETKNIRVFHDDAVDVLQCCVADESLSRVQIFFPDPWQKQRHHKRRLIQQEFVDKLVKKLEPGGIIHLATDWENYAVHMLRVMDANAVLINMAGAGSYCPRPETRPKTKFEQRGQRLGHGVWDLIFTKS